MLSNGACHLGNDVFIAGMADVDDCMFTLLGSEYEELPLKRTVQWCFTSAEDANCALSAAGAAGGADAKERSGDTSHLRSHSTHASPDGRYVLGLSTVTRQHYLINTDGGDVTIFETRDLARGLVWHPQQGDVAFVLLACGDVDVYCVSEPLEGSALPRIATIPCLKLIHGYLGAASANNNMNTNKNIVSPSRTSTSALATSLTTNLKGSSTASAASFRPATATAASRNTSSPAAVAAISPSSDAPNHSQLCVLNAFNSTLVNSLVAMAFVPPTVGQPLLLAVAATNGDVYVIKLNAECTEAPLAKDAFMRHVAADYSYAAYAQKALAAPSGYVRLLISNPSVRGGGGGGGKQPLSLNTFLMDVRQGRVAVSMLHADGVLRTYYVRPSDLITVAPTALTTPARTQCDHETLLCSEGISYGSALSAADTPLHLLVSVQQASNVLLVRTSLQEEAFIVALPIWLRQQHVWSLRYDSMVHRGGFAVLPLSNSPHTVPGPLAVRLPFDVFTYSVALGMNDVMLFPRMMADGTHPIAIKLEHVLETAMMAMHRKGARLLNASVSSDAAASSSSLTADKKAITAASSSSPPLPPRPTDPTSEAILALVSSSAKGCAAFYEDTDQSNTLGFIAKAEGAVSSIHNTLVAKEEKQTLTMGALKSQLSALEAKQSTLLSSYQRMLDIANQKDLQQHGVSALVELNKLLGELHHRLNVLEEAHSDDMGRAERAVGSIRDVKNRRALEEAQE